MEKLEELTKFLEYFKKLEEFNGYEVSKDNGSITFLKQFCFENDLGEDFEDKDLFKIKDFEYPEEILEKYNIRIKEPYLEEFRIRRHITICIPLYISLSVTEKYGSAKFLINYNIYAQPYSFNQFIPFGYKIPTNESIAVTSISIDIIKSYMNKLEDIYQKASDSIKNKAIPEFIEAFKENCVEKRKEYEKYLDSMCAFKHLLKCIVEYDKCKIIE